MQLITEENHFAISDIIEHVREATENDKFITVDTEFIREHLETPLLCLIQIATDKDVFIFDCSYFDLSRLKPVFEDIGIKKVFHSARQDIEILCSHGITVRNFYDTQLYESVLGIRDNISYREIVKKYTSQNIAKECSMSDWASRPLREDQLTYAANDVTYLREVYTKQLQRLNELSRYEWLDDELQKLSSEKDEGQELLDSVPKSRVAVLRSLLDWRSAKSQELNINIQEVVSDSILRSVCKKGLPFVRMLKNSRITKDKVLKDFLNYAKRLIKSSDLYLSSDKNDIAIYMLKALLTHCSQKENVAANIIVTSRELEQLVFGDRNLRCCHGWRFDVFGKLALQILDGYSSLRLQGETLCIE